MVKAASKGKKTREVSKKVKIDGKSKKIAGTKKKEKNRKEVKIKLEPDEAILIYRDVGDEEVEDSRSTYQPVTVQEHVESIWGKQPADIDIKPKIEPLDIDDAWNEKEIATNMNGTKSDENYENKDETIDEHSLLNEGFRTMEDSVSHEVNWAKEDSVSHEVTLAKEDSVPHQVTLANKDSVPQQVTLANKASVSHQFSLLNEDTVSKNDSIPNEDSFLRIDSFLHDGTFSTEDSITSEESLSTDGSFTAGISHTSEVSHLPSVPHTADGQHSSKVTCTTESPRAAGAPFTHGISHTPGASCTTKSSCTTESTRTIDHPFQSNRLFEEFQFKVRQIAEHIKGISELNDQLDYQNDNTVNYPKVVYMKNIEIAILKKHVTDLNEIIKFKDIEISKQATDILDLNERLKSHGETTDKGIITPMKGGIRNGLRESGFSTVDIRGSQSQAPKTIGTKRLTCPNSENSVSKLLVRGTKELVDFHQKKDWLSPPKKQHLINSNLSPIFGKLNHRYGNETTQQATARRLPLRELQQCGTGLSSVPTNQPKLMNTIANEPKLPNANQPKFSNTNQSKLPKAVEMDPIKHDADPLKVAILHRMSSINKNRCNVVGCSNTPQRNLARHMEIFHGFVQKSGPNVGQFGVVRWICQLCNKSSITEWNYRGHYEYAHDYLLNEIDEHMTEFFLPMPELKFK